METKEELLKKLSDGVFEMEEDDVEAAATRYIELGYPAFDGIMDGLVAGMNRASEMYEEEEYFVTDLLLCSDAMYLGLEILKPHLIEEKNDIKKVGAIGVIEGDTHDIGKNLVRIMLETAGYTMIDLGRDVALDKYVEVVKNEKVDFICMSTLMTSTMQGMDEVIKKLVAAGLRDQVKVIIGGGPISTKFVESIKADGYANNAVEAVKVVNDLLKV